MAVSDREIDRAMQYGLEDFDWLWAVVEMARGRCWLNERSAPPQPRPVTEEEN